VASNETNDMQRMQQDAIRRVREMQSRANQSLNRSQSTAPQERPAHEASQHSQQNHSQPSSSHSAPAPPSLLPDLSSLPQASSLNSLFDSLLQDGERTLILVLILILVSEKADTGLIFALMYLII